MFVGISIFLSNGEIFILPRDIGDIQCSLVSGSHLNGNKLPELFYSTPNSQQLWLTIKCLYLFF